MTSLIKLMCSPGAKRGHKGTVWIEVSETIFWLPLGFGLGMPNQQKRLAPERWGWGSLAGAGVSAVHAELQNKLYKHLMVVESTVTQ